MTIPENVDLGIKGRFGNVNINTFKDGVKKTDLKNAEHIQIFNKFDKDQNGVLSENELQELVNSLGNYAEDGKITQHEAGKFLKSNDLKGEMKEKEVFDFLNQFGILSDNITDTTTSIRDDGTKTINVEYKPNDAGEIITEIINEGTGNLYGKKTVKDGKTVTQYFTEDGKIKQENTEENGVTTITKYDENGNITSAIRKKGSVTEILDADGRVVKKQTDKGSGIKEIVEYEYDDNGNVAKTTTTNADGTKIIDDGVSVTTINTDGSKTVENKETGAINLYDKDGKDITQQTNIKKAFNNGKVAVTIDGKATGLTSAETYNGTISLPDGVEIEDGKFPPKLRMTLPEGYIGTMELTLIDAEKGIYETSAKDRNFQIVVGDDGSVSVKSVNIKELKSKLNANLEEYNRIAEEKRKAEEVPATEQTIVAEEVTATEETENVVTLPFEFRPADLTDVFPEMFFKDGNEVADSLYNDIHQIGTGKDFDKHINEIKAGNVVDVITSYNEKSPKESLVEAIFDEIGLDMDKRISSVNVIKEALIKKSQNLGVLVDELNKNFEEEFKDATTGILSRVGYVDTEKLDEIINQYVERITTMEGLDQAARQKYVDDMGFTKINDEIQAIPKDIAEAVGIKSDDLFGDGKIDEASRAVQLTGNCWAHADINALVATPAGKELINNLITKKDGVIAVKLPEAANKGLPKPNGDGIYTFSEFDIVDGNINQSIGDGDITAVMLAVSQYFIEIGERSDIDNNMAGNTPGRMFEILTGEEQKSYLSKKIPDGVGVTLMKSNKKYYENLKELLDNGQVAIEVTFKENTSERTDINSELLSAVDMQHTYGKSFITERHAYAVTKIDDTHVYLIESNNPDTVIKMPKEDFLKIANVVSTYKF